MSKQREQAELYADVLATVHEGLWVTDADDRIIFFNPQMEAIAGVSAGDVLGLNVTTDFPNETVRDFLPHYEAARRDLQPTSYESDVVTPAGRATIQVGTLTPRIRDGVFAGMICTIQDVTEQRRAERTAIDTERRAHRLLDITPAIILSLDRGGRIALMNQAGGRVLECDHEDVIGVDWFETFIPEEDRETVRQVFSSLMAGEVEAFEHHDNEIVTRQSGRRKLIHWHNALLTDDAGVITGLLSSGQDITAEHADRRELEAIKWMLMPSRNRGNGNRSRQPRPYGNLARAATLTTIRDAVGEETLTELVGDFLDLLDTSSAVYEKNGDYALGIFSSDWCRCLEAASHRLCGTDDVGAALDSGSWLCHDACWKEASKPAIERGEPVDIECPGGIRLYAIPIRAGDEVVGAINFGYGTPPLDRVEEIAAAYGVPAEELRRVGEAHEVRPPFLVNMAKRRLETTARIIGEAVLRKRAEDALRESETRFRSYFESAPFGLFIADGEGRYREVNPAACRITGYSREELLAMRIRDLVPPAEQAAARNRFRQLKATGSMSGETAFRHKDGRKHYWRLSAVTLGQDRHLAFAVDVTQTRRAESDYRMLFERMREGFALHEIVLDEAGQPVDYRFLAVNPAFEIMTGLRAEDVVGQTVLEVLPQTEKYWIDTYGRVALTGEPVFFESYASDLGRHFQVTAFRPAPGRFACIFTDITERVLAEQALRAGEERLQLVIKGSTDAPWDWDLAANERYYSPQWWQQLGYEPNELDPAADLWEGLMHPDDAERVQNRFRTALEEGTESYEVEFRLQHKEEHYVPVLSRGVITRDDDGTPVRVTGTNMDLTDQKRAEAEHEALQKRLLQAQKMESVGRLAGGVAHDFNNLLMGIINYVELCRGEVAPDHPIRSWLDEITVDAKRSAAITKQLLAFARRQTIAPKVLDLNEAVGNLLKMLRHLIGEDIDLSWEPGANLWPVLIDPAQVDQILANLAINARDAIGGVGKLTVETSTARVDDGYSHRHADAVPGDYAVLGVSDDGCGMDDETLAHIFEPFFTTKDSASGTGLGLATIYGIVLQNNGFVNVYSEVGQGTTFRIYLPRHREGSSVSNTREQARPLVGGDETVLVVEDEKSIRVTTRAFLEKLGYRVLAAATPAAARRLLAEEPEPPDLLLTDVILPGMSGRGLADILTAEHPSLKVLYMSGYTANVIAHHGVLEDDVNFLAKPFSRDDLVHAVRTILDRPAPDA